MAPARTQTAGGSGGTDGPGGDGTPLPFREAVAALGGTPHRPEIHFGELPPPKRLAPFAHALEASVQDGDEELADGRFVLLYDPHGRDAWHGVFRVVTLGRTGLEPEMAADPLLPEVTWSWLTGALEAYGLDVAAPSGTVTRSGSYYFGDMADRTPQAELEIRASWTPAGPAADGGGVPDVAAHLTAWCELLCQCAGLPPSGEDGDAVVQLPQRRGPRPQ